MQETSLIDAQLRLICAQVHCGDPEDAYIRPAIAVCDSTHLQRLGAAQMHHPIQERTRDPKETVETP